MMPVLTNPRAERVKSVRALSGRSSRLRTGRFVVEGPQGVREAVREVPERIHDLYVTAPATARYPEILRAAHATGVRVHEASEEVLAAMSGDAQGVLAVVAAADPSLAGALDNRPRLVAILARVRDPGNAGAVIRAADAAGADLVVLTSESVDLYNPKVVRATAGSLFHLPVVTGVSLAEAVAAVREAGLRVLAADGAGDLDLDDLLDLAGHAETGTDDPGDEEYEPPTPQHSDPTHHVHGLASHTPRHDVARGGCDTIWRRNRPGGAIAASTAVIDQNGNHYEWPKVPNRESDRPRGPNVVISVITS